MRHWLPAIIVLAVAAAPIVACGETSTSAGGAWAGRVDTLASGRLVVRNADVPLWLPGEEWQLRERFRIGRAVGVGPELFGEIRDVDLGPDGLVYVLDSQASEVRVFGSDGAHIRTFGREGQGPGELRRPIGMAFDPEGALWIVNWGNGRYSAFEPGSGEVLREPRRLASFAMIPWPGRFDLAGRLLDIGLAAGGEPAILRLDTAFIPADTLALPRADDRHQIFFRRNGQMVMSMMEPFAPQPAWAAHPAGGIVVGEGSAYRIHRIGFDGDTIRTFEVERARAPVTGEERDSALAAFEQASAYAEGAVPDRRPSVPDVKPAHGRLIVDDEGRIWVSRTGALGEPLAWDVIDEDGRLLGTVTSPLEGMPLTIRGDRLALSTTIDDVPAVVVFDIVRPGRADR